MLNIALTYNTADPNDESSYSFPIERDTKEQVKFLQRFLNYLRSFSKILYVEHNNSQLISKGKDTSYFALLDFSRSEILEKLLFEKKLDLHDFEQLFSKLKLDLIHHVATIFFPKVHLSINQRSNENKYVKPNVLPNNNIITYVQKRNWLLAFILNEMYKIEETKLDLNEIRIKTFINFIKLSRIQNLKSLFDNNEVVTALQQNIAPKLINTFFEQHIIKSEVEASQHSTSSLETGKEIFEGDLKITDWKHLFDVIDSIPFNQLQKSKELLDLRDMVLNELISDCFEPDYFKYVQFISDNQLRWECILNNMTTWPGQFCIEVFESELSRFDKIDEKYEKKFVKWCEKIRIYEKVSFYFV
ncbi:hypothetical protein ILUMI_24475 [Ignelater luminosus]|uniref:Uncharacterized protein n=1 Tax=Ignelater luminosus TaxID=2038154 RepID=A0A8K0C703_IGNLU|nr:hypothetical protein ILUMI_24475 [Ignelater luminosus]